MGGGGPTYFFGLKIYTLGIRNLSHVFLGLKKYAYCFGSYLRVNFSFRVLVAISGLEKCSFAPFFFSDMCSRKNVNIKKTIQCTMRYLSVVFLGGWKFSCQVFFWV